MAFSSEASHLSYVLDALHALPQPYARVLELYYQENLSCGEIAVQISRSEERVRRLLRAGRALLIKNLQRRAAFQAARRYME